LGPDSIIFYYMNIGIDIKAFKNGATGISKYIRRLLDALQQIDPVNRYYLFECRESDYAPVNPNWKKITQNSRLPGTVWMQTALPKLIKKYKIDLFWAPEQLCPVFGMPRNVKVATTVHDFTYRRFPETCMMSVRLVNKLFMGPTVKKSDAIFLMSDCMKKELLEFYPRARSTQKIIHTVYSCVTAPGAEMPDVPRENFLFFPGNLEPRKNLARVIKALEIVNESGIDTGFHMCGPKGWKNTDFHRQIESSPIKDRIKHLGFLSDEEVRDQYLRCRAVIFPSIYEGFGLPVLEALMMNTPVITSKGSSMEEIAGTSAVYCDPYNVNSIAEAIIAFMKTGGPPINRYGLKRYINKQSAENLLKLFGQIVSGKSQT